MRDKKGQAFSVAGKRKGFEDTRGTLFFEIARIAREKQPKALLLENVKGLVNHDKGRTLDIMIETLNEIGYTVDFDVLNSKYFGVPQNRERIFIVAIRKDLIEAEPFSEEATKGHTIVPKGKRRIGEWADVFNFDWPEQTEVTTRLLDILEPEVDEKYYLDEEKTARLVAQLVKTKQGGMDKLKITEPQMLGHVDIRGNDSIKRTYSTEGISPTLTTMEGGHRQPKIAEPQEIANIDDLSYCIDANYSKGISPSSIGKGRRTHIEEQLPKYRIRKLTPLECWRLQGFPDEAHDAVESAGISDSQRYRQAGNAVTVNVIKAIGERLIPIITEI